MRLPRHDMDDIARQAGMSKKTVYQVFPSKAVLFEALLMNRCSIFTVDIDDDDRAPPAVLTDVLFRSVTHALTERQIAILRLMVAETPRSPKSPRPCRIWVSARPVAGWRSGWRPKRPKVS